MTLHLRVAVVTADLPTYLPPVGDQSFDVPYGDRLAVELEISEDETLGATYRHATELLSPQVDQHAPLGKGFSLTRVSFAWFYEPSDEQNLNDKRWDFVEDLITVDATGAAHWNRGADEIPYGDLVRASERGLLRGDALRPYLILILPQGDAGAFGQAWEVTKQAWDLLEHGLAARELLNLAKDAVRRRRPADVVRDGKRVVESHQDVWASHRGGPAEILRTLDACPWPADDLRMALGLDSKEEAQRLLELYGFVPNEEGRYEVSAQWEQVLHVVAEDATSGHMNPEISHEEHARRLLYMIRTGELPGIWEA